MGKLQNKWAMAKKEKIPPRQPHNRTEDDPPTVEEGLWLANEKIKGSHANPTKAPVPSSMSQRPEETLAWVSMNCRFAKALN